MSAPPTKYARSGDVHIAYTVLGTGPPDIVYFSSGPTQLEALWQAPRMSHVFDRLAEFSRVIVFDKRGTGLSDRTVRVPTVEHQLDDVLAVMDAAGSSRPVLFGSFDGGAVAILFAATYPERSEALVTFNATPTMVRSAAYPWGAPPGTLRRLLEGDDEFTLEQTLPIVAPSRSDDPEYQAYYAHLIRTAAGPGAYDDWLEVTEAIDVRHALPVIRMPTLVLHRKGNLLVDVENARYLASHIAGAKRVELPGPDHLLTGGDVDAVVDEIEEFLTGIRPAPEPDRVLATVLFTDIVGSTERAAEVGDRRWRELLDAFHAAVRAELQRAGGREVDTAGDGLLATFDGPGRATRAAVAIRDAVAGLGLEVRTGLHTGECELAGDKVRGIAVHIGARVAALAAPGEVLVSSTVKDLVAGSGIAFEDRGTHALKGVPGEWRVFAVTEA